MDLGGLGLDALFFLTILSGFVIGFLINFTGVGGGVLLVPVLTLFFRLEISVAVGTASIFVTLIKILATIENVKLKTINYRSCSFFLFGAVPGVLLASGLINYLLSQSLQPEEIQNIQNVLKQIVVGAILFSVLLMLFEKLGIFKKLKSKLQPKQESILLVVFGIFIGIVMGLTGIGGGVLIFPTFYLLTKLSSKQIVSAANYISLLISGITAAIYSGGGQVDFKVGIQLTVGSLLGVYLASKMLKKVSIKILDYVIIFLIFASGLIMLFVR